MKKQISIFLSVLLIFSLMPISFARENDTIPRLERSIDQVREKAQEAKQNYLDVRNRYNQLKTDYNNAKQDFIKIRDTIRNANNNTQGDGFERYKLFLIKVTERLDNAYSILIKWIENAIQDEDLKIRLNEYINEDLKELENLKARLEASTNIGDLREISLELQELKNKAQYKIKNIANYILSNKLSTIIDRAESISEGFHKRLDNIEETEETIEMQELLSQFDNLVEKAKSEYEEAKSLFKPVSSLDEANSQWKEIRKHLTSARDYLREAYKILRELTMLWKEYNNLDTLSTTALEAEIS